MDLNKYQELEKNKNNLKFRITFFFVFFLVALFAIFIVTSVLQVTTVVRYVCSQIALPTVERAAKLIDPVSFEKLANSLDPKDPYYEEMNEKLYELKQNTGSRYLYTMAPVNGSVFRYIIDGSGEDSSALGEEEDIGLWEKAAIDTFTTGQTMLGTIDQNEQYGATITAYQPIKRASGEVLGFIACDIAAEEIIHWVRTQVAWQIAIVSFLAAVGLAAYITVMQKVNRSFTILEESE